MSKSKFTLNPNKPSKLLTASLPQDVTKTTIAIPEKIRMGGSKRTTIPTTFSFKEIDKDRLKDLEGRVRNISSKKITAVDIIRGLLILAENVEAESLILHIQQSFLE